MEPQVRWRKLVLLKCEEDCAYSCVVATECGPLRLKVRPGTQGDWYASLWFEHESGVCMESKGNGRSVEEALREAVQKVHDILSGSNWSAIERATGGT